MKANLLVLTIGPNACAYASTCHDVCDSACAVTVLFLTLTSARASVFALPVHMLVPHKLGVSMF